MHNNISASQSWHNNIIANEGSITSKNHKSAQ